MPWHESVLHATFCLRVPNGRAMQVASSIICSLLSTQAISCILKMFSGLVFIMPAKYFSVQHIFMCKGCLDMRYP
jgi:hypothetical protein